MSRIKIATLRLDFQPSECLIEEAVQKRMEQMQNGGGPYIRLGRQTSRIWKYTLNMGTDDGQDYREHYADLTKQLQSLRRLFSLNESLSSFRAYFDEELDANEFEIALSALCDFLLEPETPGIALAELERIDAAFRAMNLSDDRIAALQAKSQIWFPPEPAS